MPHEQMSCRQASDRHRCHSFETGTLDRSHAATQPRPGWPWPARDVRRVEVSYRGRSEEMKRGWGLGVVAAASSPRRAGSSGPAQGQTALATCIWSTSRRWVSWRTVPMPERLPTTPVDLLRLIRQVRQLSPSTAAPASAAPAMPTDSHPATSYLYPRLYVRLVMTREVMASPAAAQAVRTANGSSEMPLAGTSMVSRMAWAMYWKGSHSWIAAAHDGRRSAG
jgi:hypothetical protein